MLRSFLLIFTVCAIAFAQAPPPGPGGPGGGGRGGGRGMPAPTNLKVLTPENYIGVMFSIPQALGVKCDFCHNMEDRASDEKPTKVTARKMMEMVKNINATTFNGEQKVTCYTCHHGEQKPAAPPPMPGRGPGGPGGPPPPAPPPQ
jgi:photosynthetic reaction center cytochrome c subunit